MRWSTRCVVALDVREQLAVRETGSHIETEGDASRDAQRGLAGARGWRRGETAPVRRAAAASRRSHPRPQLARVVPEPTLLGCQESDAPGLGELHPISLSVDAVH